MEVSIEAYFLMNLAMDLLVVGVVARSLGHVRPGRVLLAGIVGAVYATLAQLPALHILRGLPLQGALAIAMAWIGLPPRPPRKALSGAASLLGGILFLGGVQFFLIRRQHLLPLPAFALGGCAGALALAGMLAARRRRLSTWEVRIQLRSRYGRARFCALIDTGNRLHEPLSGRPVLIAEEVALRNALPPGFDAASAAENVPAGFRAVGFGALGGSGRMACFRPEAIYVDCGEGYVRAPDAWVAIYPGRMTGGVCALAPAEFGCVDPPRSLRRFHR